MDQMSAQGVRQVFKRHFGYPPAQVVGVPGRVEMLGNHTDYNEGMVMAVAVDRQIWMAGTPRTDGRIEVVSSAYPTRAKFWMSELRRDPGVLWADYVKGVLHGLREAGVHFSGFSAAIHSMIPAGGGMSSSAALQVATALLVRRMWPFRLTERGCTVPPRKDDRGGLPPMTQVERLYLARLIQKSEMEFVGVRCGILDPLSILNGRGHHVMNIDCRFDQVEFCPLIGEALVVCPSGVRHSLVDGAYNEIRRNCDEAAAVMGVKSLRSVELGRLKACREKLTARQYACAYHVVGEIQRTIFAERALRADDHAQFGEYMFQSHESSRDLLGNSCAELDMLVELGRGHPACLGARLTGGGFGGATVHLVRHHLLEEYLAYVVEGYEKRTGREMEPMVCGVVDGADAPARRRWRRGGG